MALAALTSGKRTPSQAIHDPGFFQIPGQATASATTSRAATARSTCTSRSSCRATPTTTCSRTTSASTTPRASSAQFGFGQKTGIDIEGELHGRAAVARVEAAALRRQEFREEHEVVPGRNDLGRHRPGLQRVHAAAARAGDRDDRRRRRRCITPHLVQDGARTCKTGERARDRAASRRRGSPSSPSTSRSSSSALVGVNKEGTAPRAFEGAQYVSGGKTGTAQVYLAEGREVRREHRVDERQRDHALFIAFAPADNPQIALAVLVENGGFGAQAAAPIARKVLDYYLLGSTEPGAAPGRARQRRRRERLSDERG